MPRLLRRTASAQGPVVRASRWSRVTSLVACALTPSVIVALLFSISACCFVAADAQARALDAAAATVRVPMLFTGAVAAGPPPPPQCDPDDDPDDFARGESAARVDVAGVKANPRTIPAPRAARGERDRWTWRGWPLWGYSRCAHCVNARSASCGGVARCAEAPAIAQSI
jgi:hypothetical protein